MDCQDEILTLLMILFSELEADLADFKMMEKAFTNLQSSVNHPPKYLYSSTTFILSFPKLKFVKLFFSLSLLNITTFVFFALTINVLFVQYWYKALCCRVASQTVSANITMSSAYAKSISLLKASIQTPLQPREIK